MPDINSVFCQQSFSTWSCHITPPPSHSVHHKYFPIFLAKSLSYNNLSLWQLSPGRAVFSHKNVFRSSTIYFVVFSVTVSAKDGDGSVHVAIQSLVRHLLLKKMKLNNKNGTFKNLFNMNKKSGEIDDDSETIFLPFLKTGINEVFMYFYFIIHSVRMV